MEVTKFPVILHQYPKGQYDMHTYPLHKRRANIFLAYCYHSFMCQDERYLHTPYSALTANKSHSFNDII